MVGGIYFTLVTPLLRRCKRRALGARCSWLVARGSLPFWVRFRFLYKDEKKKEKKKKETKKRKKQQRNKETKRPLGVRDFGGEKREKRKRMLKLEQRKNTTTK